jgi:hypothetical protein
MKQLILGVAIAALSPFVVPAAQTVRQGETLPTIPHVFQSPMIIETVFAAADRALWRKGWFDIPAYQALGQSTCDGVALRRKMRRNGEWEAGLQMRAKAVAGDMVEVTIRVHVWNPRDNHDKAVTLVLELLTDPPAVAPIIFGPMRKEDNGLTAAWTGTYMVPIRGLTADPPTPMRITMTTKDY